MRSLDWVDRLAGVDYLEQRIDRIGNLTPMGAWLSWPKWRRLVDLARARLWEPVRTGAQAICYSVSHWQHRYQWGLDAEGADVYYPTPGELYEIEMAVRDIHILYALDLSEDAALLEGVEAD